MSKPFRPLLAATADLDKVTFPCTLSRKLDGIRVLAMNGKAMTRSMKELPNRYIQSVFSSGQYDGLDGEIIVGPPNAPDVYRVTNSAVTSHEGEPEFTYHVFDRWDIPGRGFSDRYASLSGLALPNVSVLQHLVVYTKAGIDDIEARWLAEGYEGVMGRSLTGIYKQGRSTVRDGILWKLKRMASSEAVIEGVIELERNLNEATTNSLGYTERSTSKDGKVGGETMGALLVRDLYTNVQFTIGTGFTAQDRDWFWSNRLCVAGKIITYNHFTIGSYDKPRFPSYKGFRDPADLAMPDSE